MSIQNFLVKTLMRLTGYRNKIDRLTLEERQKDNLPDPPESIVGRFDRETVTVDGSRAVWLSREHSSRGVMVYLHGGCYTAGPFKEQWQYLADLCRRTQMAALLIDYKLAPQNPFPAGLDDVLVILETLLSIGDLPRKWFLLGDSAGAGLAASVIFELREMKEALPKKLILMSGWFDLTLSKAELRQNPNIDPRLSLKRLTESAESYISHDDAKNPLISPIYGNPANFPPTLIQCGTADLLIWDNREFYRRCKDAGIEVRYEEYPNLIHDFMMIGFLPEAKKARKSQAEFLLS